MQTQTPQKKSKFPLFRCWIRVLHTLARFMPGATSLRPFLHRSRGVKISGRVFIGDDVYIENEYPEAIEIHDGAQITLRTTIIAHTRGTGHITIGKNVFIGAGSLIWAPPGKNLTIGEGAVIGAMSLVTTSVPAFTFVASPRAKPVAHVSIPLEIDTEYDEFVNGLRPLASGKRVGGSSR